MTYQPRYQGQFGYFHLITKGNGGQIIFEDRKDRIVYLNMLKRFAGEENVIINAFCLMDNHVHLLIYDPEDKKSGFMQKLNVSYAVYFNKKYKRNGHLFQGRYKGEAVESEGYLLTVFRYILNNPRNAGICNSSDYEWNSYRKYGLEGSFVDTQIFLELLGDMKEYTDYLNETNDDICMDIENDLPHDDEWAKSVIHKELDLESGVLIQSMPREQRDIALRVLKKKGLSLRQIERLTGINRRTVQRA